VLYESRSRHYLALAISAFISTSDFLMKAQMFSAMTRGVFAKLKSYLPSLRGLAASSVKGKLKASATFWTFTRDSTGLSSICASSLTYDVSGETNWESAPTKFSQSTQHLVHHAIIPPLSPHFQNNNHRSYLYRYHAQIHALRSSPHTSACRQLNHDVSTKEVQRSVVRYGGRSWWSGLLPVHCRR
jgi:hypothetical protein